MLSAIIKNCPDDFKPILNKVGLDLENNKKNTLSVEHIVSQIINYE